MNAVLSPNQDGITSIVPISAFSQAMRRAPPALHICFRIFALAQICRSHVIHALTGPPFPEGIRTAKQSCRRGLA